MLQQHLGAVAEAVEAACLRYRGEPVATMVGGLVAAFVDAKTARADVSRALYLVADELDTAELLGSISKRMRKAAVALLDNAADARFDDLPAVTFTLLAAMAGTTRAVFEHGATPSMLRMLRLQLAAMCQA